MVVQLWKLEEVDINLVVSKGSIMLRKFALSMLKRSGLLSRPNPFFVSNLYSIGYLLKSRKKYDELRKDHVACIMCTWDEKFMVPLAIKSSKNFVSRYIIVDKDGSTVPAIKKCNDRWGLDIEIYVKPNLDLRESRAFALSKIDEPWIMIQDGDEVFHTDGPNSIFTLRKYMCRRNIILCAPLNILQGDFYHTSQGGTRMSPHPFVYHNNGTIRPPPPPKDQLVMDGWKIRLPYVYKFNCRVKSPKSLFLRIKTRNLRRNKEEFEGCENLEEYAIKKMGITDLYEKSKQWYDAYLNNLRIYDEKKWGYYPKILREYMSSH